MALCCSGSKKTMEPQRTICIIGSGEWGSAIVSLLCKGRKKVDDRIRMYVDSKEHKPHSTIPDHVVTTQDACSACTDADILIFVLPIKSVQETCQKMASVIKKNAVAVSFIRNLLLTESGFELASKVISKTLSIECAVVTGANSPADVAKKQFCEFTIGSKNRATGLMLQHLLQTPCFRGTVIEDADTAETCSALVNAVGIAVGVIDGLKYGDNTKAAVIRIGLMEIIHLCQIFSPGCKTDTFFESCGAADLIATSYGWSSRLLGEAVVKSSKGISELEETFLPENESQGPLVVDAICLILERKKLLHKFPLFAAIQNICKRHIKPTQLIDCIRHHPVYM